MLDVLDQPSARPALASFAEFLKQAFAFELDVSPDEFRVGRQPIVVDGTRSEQLFIADALENGAGYARMAADQRTLGTGLRLHFDRQKVSWSRPAHSELCDRSCPDCLRNYGNRFSHGMLDWRLALDLSEVALGEEIDTSRWLGDVGERQVRMFAELCDTVGSPVNVEKHGGLICVERNGKGLIFGHPLWHVAEGLLQPSQLQALSSFRDAHGTSPEFVDIRDFGIRPATYILKLQS